MLQGQIRTIVAEAAKSTFSVGDAQPEISYPDPRFGDFATNLAFALAKTLKKAPKQIAEELAAGIKHADIQEATAVNGFINLKMTTGFWINQLHLVTAGYAANSQGDGQKLQVEFISANPTGPLTLGNARGGYLGDVLARVMVRNGYEVVREYYFNNAGTQIKTLVDSVKAAAGLLDKTDKHYPGEYIDELAKDFADKITTLPDKDLAKLLTETIFERWIKPAINKMGIGYDEWFNESDLITGGGFQKTLDELSQRKLVSEHDGAIWLNSASLGDNREERVLRKSNGDLTYLATDIAYHRNIFIDRKFNTSIKVWGADHAGQVDSLRLAVSSLVPDARLEFVLMQWVRLIRDGKEIKMSKRAGTYVTVEELIDEVGSDVARFLFLMRSADTAMDFDLEAAKEQTQKNPYYYVMYSYARASSLLQQASMRHLTPISTLEVLSQPEIALTRHLSRFPDLIADIGRDYSVHKLTFFGVETAQLFHDLYESERIIDLDKAEACKRLYVIERYINFMRVYFDLLGITPVEHMESAATE
jgi:arginyl-tRNA synthetase